ncbi:MAG: zf-HC2 domain-containing protein [Candidatus Hydrogenedens sp.]|nr:zf-HC2 domain-containing protein [Candidatus Hydrogenedens sp.]
MKTTCNKYRIEILDYLTGNLSPEEAKPVATHIASCPDCQNDINDLGILPYLFLLDDDKIGVEIFQAQSKFQAEQEAARSEELVKDSQEEYARPSFSRFFSLRALISMGVAAAILLVVAGGLLYRSDRSEVALDLARSPMTEKPVLSSGSAFFQQLSSAKDLFRSYEQKTHYLTQTATLGSLENELFSPLTETEGKIRQGSYLFAVQSSEGEFLSTAALLARKEELLLCLDPVSDLVLLRSVTITREHNTDPETTRINDELTLMAHKVSENEREGISLLYAPGISAVLPPDDNLATGLEAANLQGTQECFIAAFHSIKKGTSNGDPAPPFYFDNSLPLQFQQTEELSYTLSCEEEMDTEMPSRLFLFAGETTGLTGILDWSPDKQNLRLLTVEIQELLRDSDAVREIKQTEYLSNRKEILALANPERETTILRLTLQDKQELLVHTLSQEAVVLHFPGKDDQAYAIHSALPGALIAQPLSQESAYDDTVHQIFSDLRQLVAPAGEKGHAPS